MPDRDWVDWTAQPDLYGAGPGRKTGGRNAVDMLTSHVDGDVQDDPELTEEFWYATGAVVGPGDALDSNPDQEGPL